MVRSVRPVVISALAFAILIAAGCGGNASKIVGKWSVVSMKNKEGKEEKLGEGMVLLIEFTADGNMNAGIDTANIPAEMKKMLEKNKEAFEKMSEMKHVGKYKVSGDSLELMEMEKNGGDSPFGKENKAKLTFEGDNLTLSGEDGSLKLARRK